jgi:hypothetical protein
MGNQSSSIKTAKETFTLERVIGKIAAKYITSQDFKDMQLLRDPEYCNKLTIITSNILANHFSNQEIEYLAKKTEKGKEVNKKEKDKVLSFFNHDKIRKYDVKNTLKKVRMCKEISKYYILVAKIYSAILSTINPKYEYMGSDGEPVQVDYLEKSSIPDFIRDTEKITLVKTQNYAARRGQALLAHPVVDKDGKDTGDVQFKETICDMYKPLYDAPSYRLSDEPGIQQLKTLYFDVFDTEKAEFVDMSKEVRAEYFTHLEMMYKVINNGDAMPDSVKNFADITFEDFGKTKLCSDELSYKLSQLSLPMSHQLFKQYTANNTAYMEVVKKYHTLLLELLNTLFVYVPDPENPRAKDIIVNNKLTYKNVEEIAKKTRAIIVGFYVDCEKAFISNVKTFIEIMKYADKTIESPVKDTPKEEITPSPEKKEELDSESRVEEKQIKQLAIEESKGVDIQPKPEEPEVPDEQVTSTSEGPKIEAPPVAPNAPILQQVVLDVKEPEENKEEEGIIQSAEIAAIEGSEIR